MKMMEVARDAKRELPVGWRWARLGELMPKTISSLDPADNPDESFALHSIPAFDQGQPEVVLGRLVGSTKQEVEPHDVLLSKIVPHIRRTWVVGADNGSRMIASTEWIVFRTTQAWPDYLKYALTDDDFHREFMKTTSGVGGSLLRARPALVAKLAIPLPPLREQQRIAAILEEQMAAVERARAACEARFEAAAALPGAFLREVFESSEATKWTTRRLGEVLLPHKEIIHPGDRMSGTAEFVGLEHLEPHTGRRLGSLTLDLGRLTGRKPTFRRGQIVYGYLRPYLNKVWIADFDGCSSVDQFAYGVRNDIADARFVAWFMRSPIYLRRSEVVTTTGQLPRIGTEQIAAVKIGLPPIDQQHLIANEIERRFTTRQQLCDTLRAEADAINALPAALLRQAFNGDI